MTYRHAFALLACLLPGLPVAPAAAGADTPEVVAVDAPLGPLLVVNNGASGPVRGSVPIRLDARPNKEEFAFVVLRIGDSEAFLSNVPYSVQEWDTRIYPDGKYTLVAEAHAKAWLLARSPAIEIEIRNSGEVERALPTLRAAPSRPRWPDPSWKSITVVSPKRAVLIREGLRLRRDRSHVPVRRVVEAAGGSVRWSPAGRRVEASYGWHRASMTLGRAEGRRDGVPVRLDRPPYMRHGHTQATARSLAILLDLLVGWVHEAKSVRLVTPTVPAAALASPGAGARK